MTQLITGMFHDRAEAEQAVNDLQNMGFAQNDISVLMNDQGQAREFAEGTGTQAAKGAGWGAGIGGTLGAIIAAVTTTGSIAAVAATGGLAAPIVAGPLAAAWAGAGAGGLAGGIIGGLIGAGIPEERARTYEQGLNAGGILLGVHASDDQAPEVRRILERDGADDVRDQNEDGTPQGNTATQTGFLDTAPAGTGMGTDVALNTPPTPAPTPAPSQASDTNRLQLREEELSARKQEVPVGEVMVHKEVVTETRSIDVPVTREEVVVERHPVNAAVSDTADLDASDQEIRIPVMEEQVTIEKTPVVTEEVEIGTRRVTENQHLTGTVQREELRVDDPTDHRNEMLDTDETVNRPASNR